MALADYIHNFSDVHKSSLPEAVKTMFHVRRRDRDWENIPVPAASHRDPSVSSPEAQALLEMVCLVTFKSHTDPTGHPAPDPLLLGMKAAVVWSHMSNFQLIANGEDEQEEYYCFGQEDESDDESCMEEFSMDEDDNVIEDSSGVELPIQQNHEFIPWS